MYEKFTLIDFVAKITMIKDLDELRTLEKDFRSEIKRRESAAKNWIEESDAKNLKDSITKLVAQQRLLIHSGARAEKIRQEHQLGENIGRRILGPTRSISHD